VRETTRGTDLKATGDYEAVVIGAGLGGLAAAALLASDGVRVLVLERNGYLGGRCSAYRRGGFTVDRGTHMITRIEGGPYEKLVRRLGLEGELNLKTIDPDDPPLIEFRGCRIPFPFAQWVRLQALALVPVCWRFTAREAVGSGLAMGSVLFNPGTAWLRDNIDFDRWLSHYMPKGPARDLVGSLAVPLFGVAPWELSAGMAMTALQDWFTDASSGYPEGGAGAIAATLARVIKAYGGHVETRAPVARVMTYGGGVSGVSLEDGTRLRTPVVVSNLGIKDTTRRLVGSRRLPQGYYHKIQEYRDTSMSTVQVKIAVSRRLVDAAPCLMGSADANIDLARFYQDILGGRVPSSFMGVVNVPSNIDPALAPEGQQLLLGMMLSPCEAEDWEPWLDLCEQGIEELVPGALENALWKQRLTPLDVAASSGRSSNASLGLAQIPHQVRKSRPPVATPIEGLYCVGDDTGRNGTCSELALDSALSFHRGLKTTQEKCSASAREWYRQYRILQADVQEQRRRKEETAKAAQP
jgi:phytoene dehydrogenase-like protein